MAETFTVNYNWTKPEVGASVDNWGGYINADLDGIDTTVKAVSNSLGNYLPLTGGTLTGTLFATTVTANANISVTSSNPTFSFRASGTQPVDQKNWDFYVDTTGNLSLRSLNDAYAAASTPLQFVRGTGYLSPTLTVSVPTLFNGKGVTLASNLGASTLDLSKHIALYGTTYGFNITAGRLNIVGGSLVYVNTTGDDTLVISGGGNINQFNYAASNSASNYSISKARGGSQAASAAVLQNDFLGQVNFNGHTGSGFSQTCCIRAQVTEPTPSPTAMGSQMDMLISPLGTATLRQAFVYKYGELQVLTTATNAAPAWLSLSKSGSGQENSIRGYTTGTAAANLRWRMQLGNTAAEGGSNAGSDFSLAGYSDTGVAINTPLAISRATGLGVVAGDPTAPLGIATKQYTDAAVAGYLPLAGGTLTGNLNGTTAAFSGGQAIIQNSGATSYSGAVGAGAANLILNRNPAVANNNAQIFGTSNASVRWGMVFATGTEPGSNVGSDFSINPYNDAGAVLGGNFQIQRASLVTSLNASGATAWAGVGAAGDASLMLNKATGGSNQSRIFGLRNGVFRWAISMPGGGTESGANAGSDFNITSYSDAGTSIASPISITRATGVTTFSAAIVNGPSDRSLKENIAPLDGALDKVLALQGVSFNLIATPDKREIGLIAQDVEPVVPEIIQQYATSEMGEDGELKAAEPKLALDYPKLTALLIEAVKTLTARVAVLEAARD